MDATREEIIEAISLRITDFEDWTIGTTADPHQHEYSTHRSWRCWHADSEQAAREVARIFQEKGMKSNDEGEITLNERYVYVY